MVDEDTLAGIQIYDFIKKMWNEKLKGWGIWVSNFCFRKHTKAKWKIKYLGRNSKLHEENLGEREKCMNTETLNHGFVKKNQEWTKN